MTTPCSQITEANINKAILSQQHLADIASLFPPHRMILSVFYLFKFKSPAPARPAAPPRQVEVRSRPGLGRSSERMLTVSPWQLSVRWIIVSNNVDLGVILATQELLMVTTVIIQLRPWLSLLSTPSPRLSGWWQMPPTPCPSPGNCLQNITDRYQLQF